MAAAPRRALSGLSPVTTPPTEAPQDVKIEKVPHRDELVPPREVEPTRMDGREKELLCRLAEDEIWKLVPDNSRSYRLRNERRFYRTDDGWIVGGMSLQCEGRHDRPRCDFWGVELVPPPAGHIEPYFARGIVFNLKFYLRSSPGEPFECAGDLPFSALAIYPFWNYEQLGFPTRRQVIVRPKS
jgi:hypothetical protein